jgi:uncharacterized protein YkwD
MEILNGHTPRGAAASAALLVSILVVACGGGNSDNSSSPAASPSAAASTSITTQAQASSTSSQQLAAFATEGFNWFNMRRQQIGLAAVSRNSLLDTAALGHSTYQKLNNVISHEEIPGRPGFTGERLRDRLNAAGYTFTQSSFSFGEVISATTDGSGTQATENLIGAIYHRYVLFEPMFREAGAGAAAVPGGYTYFTVNFTANGLSRGIGHGNLITYPDANQQSVDRSVFSDRETPDPVAGQDEVGYPISVHADIVADVTVRDFTVRPRGGASLPVRLLTHATDSETPPSAAAIIPVAVLAPATTYDVQFNGTVDGVPVSKAWSFATR